MLFSALCKQGNSTDEKNKTHPEHKIIPTFPTNANSHTHHLLVETLMFFKRLNDGD